MDSHASNYCGPPPKKRVKRSRLVIGTGCARWRHQRVNINFPGENNDRNCKTPRRDSPAFLTTVPGGVSRQSRGSSAQLAIMRPELCRPPPFPSVTKGRDFLKNSSMIASFFLSLFLRTAVFLSLPSLVFLGLQPPVAACAVARWGNHRYTHTHTLGDNPAFLLAKLFRDEYLGRNASLPPTLWCCRYERPPFCDPGNILMRS